MTPEIRDAVIDLAQRAGDAILAVYNSDFAVEHKDDASPLTAADLAAHRVIAEGLAQLTPDIPLLSEEGATAHPAAVRRAWPTLWVVDPLDGTREFVKRNGEFTVNIALVRAGVPVFGVIQQPVSGDLWWGAAGEGAFKRVAGQDLPLRVQSPAAEPLRVAASRSHVDATTQAFIARMPESVPVSCGSSLKFCLLAEGRMDIYPRFGPTSEWDTAAGQALLEAAGGRVQTLDGQPLRYNARDTLLNGAFVAIGDPDLPWQAWR